MHPCLRLSTLLIFAVLSLLPHLTLTVPYLSPNIGADDSSRVIPIYEQIQGNESAEAISAQLCGTPPPPDSLRTTHERIQTARMREERGLEDGMDGVESIGLEKRASNTVVETHFHIVVTTDQSKYFSSSKKGELITNQVYISLTPLLPPFFFYLLPTPSAFPPTSSRFGVKLTSLRPSVLESGYTQTNRPQPSI